MTGTHDAPLDPFFELLKEHLTPLRERLERLTSKLLKNYIPRLGRNDIEEEVGRLIEAVCTARANYDPTRPFYPWVMQVATNRLKDRQRRLTRQSKRPKTVSGEGVLDLLASPGRDPETDDRIELLLRELSQLPPDMQALIRARYWDGRTSEAVAADLRVDPGTVRRNTVMALDRLAARVRASLDRAG